MSDKTKAYFELFTKHKSDYDKFKVLSCTWKICRTAHSHPVNLNRKYYKPNWPAYNYKSVTRLSTSEQSILPTYLSIYEQQILWTYMIDSHLRIYPSPKFNPPLNVHTMSSSGIIKFVNKYWPVHSMNWYWYVENLDSQCSELRLILWVYNYMSKIIKAQSMNLLNLNSLSSVTVLICHKVEQPLLWTQMDLSQYRSVTV